MLSPALPGFFHTVHLYIVELTLLILTVVGAYHVIRGTIRPPTTSYRRVKRHRNKPAK